MSLREAAGRARSERGAGGEDPQGSDGGPGRDTAPHSRIEGVHSKARAVASVLAPAALIAYLGFNEGGAFPGTTAFAVVLVAVAMAIAALLLPQPVARLGSFAIVACGALALLTCWALASALW